jgi:hypothetical protein
MKTLSSTAQFLINPVTIGATAAGIRTVIADRPNLLEINLQDKLRRQSEERHG